MSKEYEQHLAERERLARLLDRFARVGSMIGIYLTDEEAADLRLAAQVVRQAR